MPCWVVYQETVESRQLERNKPATRGRIGLNSRAPNGDIVRAMHWVTQIARVKFHGIHASLKSMPRVAPPSGFCQDESHAKPADLQLAGPARSLVVAALAPSPPLIFRPVS